MCKTENSELPIKRIDEPDREYYLVLMMRKEASYFFVRTSL
ncbi:hypothetical protein FEDK69T_22820 [Flavobacterium enshiense DK69]|nr:hypothetical protein FEDK69T_22820 [Flavobacterium enshiense DK69]